MSEQMRWLVTGAGGMLGTDLVELLRSRGEQVTALGRRDLDVADAEQVTGRVRHADVVVNCAAWTAVDDAEEHEAEAFAHNALGPQLLARACRHIGARMVQVSTDYVFDGLATAPYAEEASLAPRSAYGRTKAAGEWAVRAEQPDHLVVRTAWLYGAHGACFPKTMARLARERDELTVVADQVGQPTWTVDLADLIFRLIAADVPPGIYHGTSAGEVSWHGLAEEVVRAEGRSPAMVRKTTAETFRRPAPRPAYSVLGHDALRQVGVAPIGHWRDRFRKAASEIL